MSARVAARRGGLFVGALTGENGARLLMGALDLYPGAHIELLGPQSSRQSIRERMARASYLVLPGASYSAMPRALIEAFASSLPVVASRSGVLTEMIEHGRNGLLFEAGSARQLARRLAWADAFPDRMRQMGEWAQADYNARLGADWSWPRLFGERRRFARAL